jgi:hypothetical protein
VRLNTLVAAVLTVAIMFEGRLIFFKLTVTK